MDELDRKWYENSSLPDGIVKEANQQFINQREADIQNQYLENANLPDRIVPAKNQKPKPAWSR